MRYVSIGDLLRAAVKEESELGRHVKSVLSSGGIIEDDTVIALIKRLSGESHIILDAFPRTIHQALKVVLFPYLCSFPSALF